MTSTDFDRADDSPDDAAARRDRFVDLPLDVRWEVTRRHPVYLLCWEGAQRHYDGEEARDSLLSQLLFQQALLLGTIGVTGRPVDPTTSADEIMASGGLEWHGSAVRPISLRAICVMLLGALPPAERLQVAGVLTASASPEHAVPNDPERTAQHHLALDRLVKLPSPVLDKFPAAPYFYVHLGASDTSIGREIIEQVGRLRNTPREDRRLRLDKISGQLAVWDLREGWQTGNYDFSRERKFAEIARELQITVSTAIDRYKSAFELILGVRFSREAWLDQFGRRKYGMANLDGRNEVSGLPRWLNSPTPRPVPESRLTPAGDTESSQEIVTRGAIAASDIEFREIKFDLEGLFAAGRSDREIADELGFESDRREELVAALRARYAEFGEIL